MPASDIAEGQGRAERDAGAGIVAAHDACHVVADGIKPGDRAVSRVERAGMLVGLDAGIGAEIADHDLDGVERTVLELRDAGIRPVQRVTAMTPGLARSMKCGITPRLPSLRCVIDTGTQAAAFGKVFSTRPPTASAIRNPSPVLPMGPGDQCSFPVGACGNIALRRSRS